MNKYWILRSKKISFLLDKRVFFLTLLLCIITILVMIVSSSVGELHIPPLEAAKTLFGFGSEMNETVIQKFRLPRILIAFIAGASLALSGAILQGVIRNPLASPDMIGISTGAGFAAVTFITMFSNKSNALTVSIHYLPVFAFIGATIAALFIYFLAWKKGVSPTRLVLIGIGLMAAFQALTTLMIILGPIYAASQATIWLTGSVNGVSWQDVNGLLPWFILSLPVLAVLVRRLNVQELGDELSTGLGVNTNRERFLFLMICTALAGSAVAFSGAIGFVGLIGPHIARRLVGSSFGGLLPVSGLIGGLIVLIADLAGRTLFSPLEVPAGVFTAAVGAPYFLYLLFKTNG
ncbi:iron ABC transporter permease [Fictibacillus sp. Mic-4]|uniref:FecCD family ABC transporter permease n=1 Tax=Fictibacillus TaxID=1329200 RepID=UPI0003F81C49|nr:iron ABC transporter permease [Fictibacillus gelatini]